MTHHHCAAYRGLLPEEVVHSIKANQCSSCWISLHFHCPKASRCVSAQDDIFESNTGPLELFLFTKIRLSARVKGNIVRCCRPSKSVVCFHQTQKWLRHVQKLVRYEVHGTPQYFLGTRNLGADVMAGLRDADVGCCPGAWVGRGEWCGRNGQQSPRGRHGG